MTVEELLEQYAAGVTNFSGIELCEANLSGAKLVGINLSQANLSVVNLSGANLSEANLSHATLNVARLSGVNFVDANLNYANLNVANLIRADLSRAQLRGASLVRTELIRAELSRADLFEANLNCADLREATLRKANLRRANLSQAILKGSSFAGANLEMANLNASDLHRSDLSGANLREADFKQANLAQANLSGADLSGANLRWADLSGANLRWADLSGAKLSGANLTGANLSNANLTNTSFVHANLTQASLIKAEWIGADLTGATLTGAKLHSASRFGLKTEGMICEWVDLSPKGDRSIIQKFEADDPRDFFNETPPTIRIIVDAALEPEANFALAGAYFHIAQEYRILKQPPSMEIGRRRTVFTFRVDSDEALLPTACIAILPFKDATSTQKSIYQVVELLNQENVPDLGIKIPPRVKQLTTLIEQAISQAQTIRQMKKNLELAAKLNFFRAPTQTILTNSSAQTLAVYNNPNFGKKFINSSQLDAAFLADKSDDATIAPLSLNIVVDFLKSFHYISE
ncbi:pentapeptide repeat-containing protein [Nostoc sp. FACHB-152]|uniref:pentapeptide repeat-containing protein n=1 Tax=unclassified Nostoc TaxID=2593658 RepID=UPI00168779C3|nr:MULTISPECIES: pentapeptide repeat-containing protein [unclassified Nostoc]MBD2448667.1 pentapeptide repeat-containing protein [Nostoc sp. FACHB-152]MBD2468348.1 pentapeptide repeat-containing protein [Nostoc sp. FACHB-145]